MKHLLTIIAALCVTVTAGAQIEMTLQQAKSLYKNTTKKRVSIHDPSVTWDQSSGRYYVFGSHRGVAWTDDMQNWTSARATWGTATSSDAANADAFTTPAVQTVTKGGQQVALPAFNATDWSARSDASYNIDGNMWAPDIIYNPTMKKWCQYLSINGDAWHSSIILLTSDNIAGPYRYQGPVVICGFYDSSHSYKQTDLELVIGTQASLPSRYNVGSKWGNRWPHTIDPAVFFDEDGQLWMVYGSWSGGIWMLRLDATTGLRDYDVTYPSTQGSSDAVTSDPYFGTKVAGGRYVSGEGPYIEHIGNHYYLFVSYGFYSPDGGYEMRVFRSDRPDGPYKDQRGVSAIFSTAAKNYGVGGDTRGEKLMGAYNLWGLQTVGECAQGHCSVIDAHDGRTYLVYHTKFNDGTVGHQVRVHQLFLNQDGWPVASPFEYNGESVTNADIAAQTPFEADEMAGSYQLLVHKYGMDYEHYEEVTPKTVTLTDDGAVSGAYSGSWQVEEGTAYITLVLNNVRYRGVLIDEQMDQRSLRAVAFTACNGSGVNVWGYKVRDDYQLAQQLNAQTVPVKEGQTVNQHIDLYSIDAGLGPKVQWTSSRPDLLSETGRYNPAGLTENTPVQLDVNISQGRYYWAQTYNVKVAADEEPAGDYKTGLVAHYGFDDDLLANSFDATQRARLQAESTTQAPTLDTDRLRMGHVVHTRFGASGHTSHVMMDNPLYGATLENGVTLSLWVRLTDENLWDDLLAFYNPADQSRLYLTGNAYIGYNSNKGNWLDINHPSAVTTRHFTPGQWQLVTIVINRQSGIRLYMDGVTKRLSRFAGSLNGTDIATEKAFDYGLMVDHIASCPYLYLGYGSFWGSADAAYDDLLVYNRPLSIIDILAVNDMCTRVYDFGSIASGIETATWRPADDGAKAVHDLSGRRVEAGSMKPGLYIKGGKKVFVR